jgi:hypothetical protein
MTKITPHGSIGFRKVTIQSARDERLQNAKEFLFVDSFPATT